VRPVISTGLCKLNQKKEKCKSIDRGPQRGYSRERLVTITGRRGISGGIFSRRDMLFYYDLISENADRVTRAYMPRGHLQQVFRVHLNVTGFSVRIGPERLNRNLADVR